MTSVTEFLSKGNESFVAENYAEAVGFYTQAINEEPENANIYSNRAHAYLKLSNHAESLEDTNKAISLGGGNARVYLRKGIALYNLEKYAEAKTAFEESKNEEGADESLSSWIIKCEEKLNTMTAKSPTNAVEKPIVEVKTKMHDWYQMESHVFVTISLKNMKKEVVNIIIEEQKLNVEADVRGEKDFKLQLNLSHKIEPSESSWKILPSKIEIKLKKREGIMWNQLECELSNSKQENAKASGSHKYPSSSVHSKDWDKIAMDIAKEEEREKPEGEAAINQLFQKIYSSGSDEVKRAMNKSFTESGGTVLSTNWTEVGSKQVDIKAPDGMEYKKWDT